MGYRKEPKSPLNFFSLGIPLTSQNQEIFIVLWCFKNRTLKNFSYENSVFKELFYLFLLFIKFTCLRYKKLHKTAIKSTYHHLNAPRAQFENSQQDNFVQENVLVIISKITKSLLTNTEKSCFPSLISWVSDRTLKIHSRDLVTTDRQLPPCSFK